MRTLHFLELALATGTNAFFAANLPASVRHKDEGLEVAAFIPLYGKSDVVGAGPQAHANNYKRLLWTAMGHVLEPLMDVPRAGGAEESERDMVDGFRYVTTTTVRFASGKAKHMRVFTCFFAMLADMEETWRMLGINGCPTCLVTAEDYSVVPATARRRSTSRCLAAIRLARSVAASKVRGGITHAVDIVSEEGLLRFHLEEWNPFLLLPFFEFVCFSMDRLHGL